MGIHQSVFSSIISAAGRLLGGGGSSGGGGAVTTPSAVASSGAKQFTLTSPTTGTMPFTLGFAFVQGHIPSTSGVVADNVTNLQVTRMNAWPDGSLKFAVLSGSVALTANTTKTITLSSGTSATGTALTTANLKATSVTASIACGSFGTVSWATTDWDSPFATHISGPQMSSWIYRKAVGTDQTLVGWLEVRLYATGAVEILPWIENGFLYRTPVINKSATYVFTMGGTQRSSQAFDLPAQCRTPLVSGSALSYWLGTDPNLAIRHDTAYLQSTEVVPSYMATVDPTSTLVTNLPSTFTPLQAGSFDYSGDAMGSTGFSSSIGPMPEHDVLYLTANAPSVYNTVVRNGYSAGRYPIHYRDETTNRPIRFSQHVHTSNNDSDTNDLTADKIARNAGTSIGTIGPDWEQAHHPSVGFMAYLLTGRYYFIDQVQFAATANYLGLNSGYRGGAIGYTQVFYGNSQVRQVAWNWRTLMTALAITPDADTTMQTEFVNSFAGGVQFYYNQYVAQSNNPMGFIQSSPDYVINLNGAMAAAATGFMAPSWQHDFLTGAVGWSLAAGLPITSTTTTQLKGFFSFVAKSIVGRLGSYANWQAGNAYLFSEVGPYFLCVSGPGHGTDIDWNGGTGPWITWAQSYQITKNTLNYYGGSYAFPESSTTLHNTVTPVSEGYVVNALPAISYAVRHGVTGAAAGYGLLTGAANWAGTDIVNDVVGSLNGGHPLWGVKPAFGAQPAWLRGVAANTWVSIPNTIQSGSAVDIQGGASPNSRLAYSGIAIKGTEVWQAATGGHGDYQGNEVISIDIGVDAPAWVIRCQPSSPLQSDSPANGQPVTAQNPAVYRPYAADGKPVVAHRYWSSWYSKETGRILNPYTRFTYNNATSGSETNGFNPVTNTWDPAGTWKSNTLMSCMDEDGNMWAIGNDYFSVQKWVPSTDTLTTVSSGGATITASPVVFDTKRKNLFSFCFGDGQGNSGPNGSAPAAQSINRSTGAVTAITITGAAFAEWSARAPAYQAMEYDVVNDRFLVYAPLDNGMADGSNYNAITGKGPTTVYAITPNGTTTWPMTALSTSGTPPSYMIGVMTRFRYIPELQGCVVLANGFDNLYFLKL